MTEVIHGDVEQISKFGLSSFLDGGPHDLTDFIARAKALLVQAQEHDARFRKSAAEIKGSKELTPEGKKIHLGNLAANALGALAPLDQHVEILRAKLEEERQKLKPRTAMSSGAELAVREAEIRTALAKLDKNDVRIIYLESIERLDVLTIAAIEAAPPWMPCALLDEDLEHGRELRLARESPELLQRVKFLEQALNMCAGAVSHAREAMHAAAGISEPRVIE